MKQRVALATVTGLLSACEAFDPSYGAAPEIPAYDAPVESTDYFVTPPASPPVGNLEVEGRLEGSLHGIRLSGETTQNYGSSSEWDVSKPWDLSRVRRNSMRGASSMRL